MFRQPTVTVCSEVPSVAHHGGGEGHDPGTVLLAEAVADDAEDLARPGATARGGRGRDGPAQWTHPPGAQDAAQEALQHE